MPVAMQLPVAETSTHSARSGGRGANAQRCLPTCTSPTGLLQPCHPTQRRHRLHGALKPLKPTYLNRVHVVAAAGAGHNPPPVATTKQKFYDSYRRPMNAIYNTVVQELLVQQHIIRYNRKYNYDEVFALGFVSVFDQVLDGLPTDKEAIFSAYVRALEEDPAKYREDAAKLEKWAGGISSPEDLHPSQESEDAVRKRLADIAQAAKDDKFLYTRFFAIGLFRLLELSKAKDPQALQALVKAMNIPNESVNRDLMTYKGVLSKLSAAKELMQEYTARERKKQQEREAAKAESKKPKEGSEEKAKEPAGAPAKA